MKSIHLKYIKLAIAVFSAVILTACGGNPKSNSAVESAHAHVHAESDANHSDSSEVENSLYQCSMHPNVVDNEPGNCPICGMDLQPVEKIEAVGIPERAPVKLTAVQKQLINIRSSVSVYEQIENQVQFAVASGRLQAHDQLPSIKELGDRLGINFNTVAKAYRDLEVMGLIYTRRGMGCYIRENVKNLCQSNCRDRINRRIFEVVQEAKSAGISKKDVNEMVSKSMAADAPLYGEPPKSILNLAKKK